MTRSSLWVLIAAAMALPACNTAPPPAQDTTAADEATLKAGTEKFLAAFNAADQDAIAATIAEDAIEMHPDGAPLAGRSAIMQGMAEDLKAMTSTQTATVDEAIVRGDLGFSRGTWSIRATPKGGGAEQIRNGKWMVVSKRQADGSWQTWRWMWNQDSTPVAKPAG